MWLCQAILCFVFVIEVLSQDTPELPIVTTVSGVVVGSVANDGDYYEYLGIPYADSTSGSHRFKAPLPPPKFTEPFIASRKDVKCIRALGVGYEGTEDCLVANVFTPTLDNTKKLPVMVWIKGREFDKVYEKELSFKRIVEKEVVVVTLNFRESILGFLCLGTEAAPGNAGLKDIIAGLQWVQNNIEQFGGNPDDVTLFGHGSGASAVDLITLSPLAEGLIHKAIIQSGNAFSPWAVARNNLRHAVQVAEALGHSITSIDDLSNIFTRASVSAIMAAINDLDLKDNTLAFSPCLENSNLESVSPFMTKSPYQTISEGEFLKIPLIIGFVDNEGTIKAEKAIESDWIQKIDDSFADFLQPDLKFKSEDEKQAVAESIKIFYFNERVDSKSLTDFISYTGDSMILVSTIREARMRAGKSTSDIYLYQFSYKGELGEPFESVFPMPSAGHSEELAYLFSSIPIITDKSDIPESDLTVSDILIERWTNFAKSGIPSSETSAVEWEPFSIENPKFIRIRSLNEMTDAESTFEMQLENPHADKMNFWNNIYEEHFLDAESNWHLEIREENGSGDGEDDGDEDDGTTPATDDGEDDDDGKDSASTAVAYTFSIITLFALLQKIHNAVLIS